MNEAEALIRLQEIDIELLREASALQKMPQQAKLRTVALAKKKVATELKRILGQRKDAQMEIEDVHAKLDHYEEVRVRVQADAEAGPHTHRELQEIELSLTSLAKHTEKAEYNLKPLEQKLEKLQLAEANAQKTAALLDEQEAALKASYEKDTSDVRARIVALDADRKEVASHVGPEVMERYEAARKRFGGLAVERLVGNVPTTCRVKLQPAQFHDIAHADGITECPYCHRILVTEQEAEA